MNELLISRLRKIYDSYGYRRYKMSKFEEYDLYAKNKNFLISDQVITFTDTNGKLMALKPDVTLSIIKNSTDGPLQKVYYDENVYRVGGVGKAFKEIKQVGLECIGAVDTYQILEVLLMAAESLATVKENSVLNLSHLGIVEALLEGLSSEEAAAVMKALSEKNVHELNALCPARAELLSFLASCCGKPSAVIPMLEEALGASVAAAELSELKSLCSAFMQTPYAPMLRIDFSVVGDAKYYNGFVFNGFVEGIPVSLLSGGQYDKLMARMGRKSKAVGFALYLDLLEQIRPKTKRNDADILLLYKDTDDASSVSAFAQALRKRGQRILVQKETSDGLNVGQVIKFGEEGI